MTRNVVFHEVLQGVQAPAVPTSATETGDVQVEVEDISQWLDYEAIEAEMLSEMDMNVVMEEPPISKEEVLRRVEARQKAPVKKQRQPGTVFMPQVDPPCPYERCRDDIVADKKDFYRQVFGVPYDSQTGIIAQMLGHADDDSTDEVIICSL